VGDVASNGEVGRVGGTATGKPGTAVVPGMSIMWLGLPTFIGLVIDCVGMYVLKKKKKQL